MEPIQIGEDVLFVIDDEFNVRPAKIVRTWGNTCANLFVMWDGSNDNETAGKIYCYPWPPVIPSRPDPWVTSVSYEKTGKKKTFYRLDDAFDIALAKAAAQQKQIEGGPMAQPTTQQ